MSIQWNNEDYLAHYGVPRRSGRYKWGSGEDPYHHGASLPSGSKKTTKKEYKERKKENKEAYKGIKKGLNKEFTKKSSRILKEEAKLDSKLNESKNRYQKANEKYDAAFEKAQIYDYMNGMPITGRQSRARIDNWSNVRKEYANRTSEKQKFKDDAISITSKKKVLDKQYEDLADKHMADRRAAYKDYKGAKKDLKNTYKNNNKEYKQTKEYRKARNKRILAVAAGATAATTTAYFATHPEARSKVTSMMKNAGHSKKKVSDIPTPKRLALPDSRNKAERVFRNLGATRFVYDEKLNARVSTGMPKTYGIGRSLISGGNEQGVYKIRRQGRSGYRGVTPKRLRRR